MPMTKNWKKINLFHWFYQVQVFSPNTDINYQYPLEVTLKDGTSLVPRVGFSWGDYYADSYLMYGMISPTNELGTKPQRCKEGFKIALGSGTTPFSEDDYCLENEIIEVQDQYKNENGRLSGASMFISGLIDNKLCMEIAGKNTSNTTWEINEIGIYTRVANMTNYTSSVSPQYYDHWFMIMREVLPNTIIVEPNKQYVIRFELSM